MNKFSAVIIAHNEERHIERCLKSVLPVADEIVVVVNADSTDKTESICRQHNAQVMVKPFVGYGLQKQFAANAAVHDWIISLDADEALNETLQQEILQLKKTAAADAYTVNIKNFYCGKWMRFAGINSTKRLRVFNRKKGNWNDAPVHENICMSADAAVEHLKGSIMHIAFESKAEHLAKSNLYSALSAKALSTKSTFHLVWKMLLNPPTKFLVHYVFKLGFVEGAQGFQYAWLKSRETFLKYERAWKFKRNQKSPLQ